MSDFETELTARVYGTANPDVAVLWDMAIDLGGKVHLAYGWDPEVTFDGCSCMRLGHTPNKLVKLTFPSAVRVRAEMAGYDMAMVDTLIERVAR